MRNLLLLLISLFTITANANDSSETPAQSFLNSAFQNDGVFIAGQPGYQELKSLNSEEVDLVINLRTQNEMDNLEFYEDYLLQQAEIPYVHLPVSGMSGLTPAVLDEFAKTMSSYSDKNVLLHCKSGRRASILWAAYQIKYRGKEVNEVKDSLKSFGWSPEPIEHMLEHSLHIGTDTK